MTLNDIDVLAITSELHKQADKFGAMANAQGVARELLIINATASMVLYGIAMAINDAVIRVNNATQEDHDAAA